MTTPNYNANQIAPGAAEPATAQTPPRPAAVPLAPAATVPVSIVADQLLRLGYRPSFTAQAPINISGVHLSFVWAELFPKFLDKDLLTTPWASLTRSDKYQTTFNQAQKNANLAFDPSQPSRFHTPWRTGQDLFFWTRYLIQTDLSAVQGGQAWKSLVPLRTAAPHTLQLDAPLFGKVKVQPFYYSFGMALTITFELKVELPPAQLIKTAFDLYRTTRFTTSASSRPLDLRDFASVTLKTMRGYSLGPNAKAGRLSPEPFTVLTVTEASGVDSQADIKNDLDKLKMLEALSAWRDDWDVGKLPPASDTCLDKLSTAPAGSALYARPRGRAAWFPALFTPPRSSASRLTCYHHNLVFAALQVEALAQLVGHTADALNNKISPNALLPWHRFSAQNAAVALAKLHSGDRGKTWRSASAKRHIDDLCFDDLNTVLAAFKEPALKPGLVASSNKPVPSA